MAGRRPVAPAVRCAAVALEHGAALFSCILQTFFILSSDCKLLAIDTQALAETSQVKIVGSGRVAG